MNPADKFKQPVAGKPAASPVPARGPNRSRWAGVKVTEPRSSMPDEGTYTMRILALEEGHNPKSGNDSAKVKLQIVAATPESVDQEVGAERVYVEIISGKGSEFGKGRFKGFVMAAAGFDSEEAFDEFDPEGGFVEACFGYSNAYSERGATIVGRLVYVQVRRGKDIINAQTGKVIDFYRNYVWGVVPEDQQNAA